MQDRVLTFQKRIWQESAWSDASELEALEVWQQLLSKSHHVRVYIAYCDFEAIKSRLDHLESGCTRSWSM